MELGDSFVFLLTRFQFSFSRFHSLSKRFWPGRNFVSRAYLRHLLIKRKGSGFDLKAFHPYALNLGLMGLVQLQAEIAIW